MGRGGGGELVFYAGRVRTPSGGSSNTPRHYESPLRYQKCVLYCFYKMADISWRFYLFCTIRSFPSRNDVTKIIKIEYSTVDMNQGYVFAKFVIKVDIRSEKPNF